MNIVPPSRSVALGVGSAAFFMLSCSSIRPGRPSSSSDYPITGRQPDLYLEPNQTGGGSYCFNPESPRLRSHLLAPTPKADDLLDASALAKDLPFLDELIRLQYSGYPELAPRNDFSLSQIFEDWRRTLDQAGTTITFDHGVLGPLRTLRAVLPDNHHAVPGWGPRLRAEPDSAVQEYQALIPSEPLPALGSCRIEGKGNAVMSTLRTARIIGVPTANHIITVSVRGSGAEVVAHCPHLAIKMQPRAKLTRREPATDSEDLYAWRASDRTAIISVRRLSGSSEQLQQLEQLAHDYKGPPPL